IETICAGSERQNQLRILRKLATGANVMRPSNHVLPMFEEMHFDDIVFGVFPFLTTPLDPMFFCTSWTSSENLLNLIVQMLEVRISSLRECVHPQYG
ncbi:hypothetical protein R3P38DRAFT_2578554, partial [Favolaschia claudopus]